MDLIAGTSLLAGGLLIGGRKRREKLHNLINLNFIDRGSYDSVSSLWYGPFDDFEIQHYSNDKLNNR